MINKVKLKRKLELITNNKVNNLTTILLKGGNQKILADFVFKIPVNVEIESSKVEKELVELMLRDMIINFRNLFKDFKGEAND